MILRMQQSMSSSSGALPITLYACSWFRDGPSMLGIVASNNTEKPFEVAFSGTRATGRGANRPV